ASDIGLSTQFRKSGLMAVQIPILAAAVTVGTAFFLLLAIIQMQGGLRELKLSRQSGGGFFSGAVVNTGAILSVFSSLNVGNVVKVEPLIPCNPLLTIVWAAIFLREIERLTARVAIGALVTVTGTILVATVK